MSRTEKYLSAWWLLCIVAFVVVIGATPVATNKATETIQWNGPLPSADTLALTPLTFNAPVEIEYIYVSNIAGGTATNANVAVIRRNRTLGADLVVWQGKVIGGPVAAPALSGFLAPPGGLYKSAAGDTLKVAVTMTGATSLYVACKYHEGR